MDETTQPLRAADAELGSSGVGFDLAKGIVDGRETQWNVDEFLGMSLVDRVRMLSGGQVRFFLKGNEVPAREALRGL